MNRLIDDSKVALWYLNQVKQTLGPGGSEKYKSFCTLFGQFGDGTLSVPDLLSSVKELLSGHHDLLQGFTFFLPKKYPITSFIPSSADPKEYTTTVINGDQYDVGYPKRQKFTVRRVVEKGYRPKRQKLSDKGFSKRQKFSDDVMSKIQQATDLANKVRERFNDSDGVYKSFLDALCGYKKEGKTSTSPEEVEKKMKIVKILFKDHPDLLIELSRYTADLLESMKKGSKGDESNDQKGRKKENPYEKMLFKYEDEHCEADVAFHRFESAKEKMELFIQDAEAAGGRPITDLNEYFTPINLRCIKQLYDEDQKGCCYGYGSDMIDQLRKNPIESGYIVLHRLNQKVEQMKDYLSGAQTVWAKVYKDCHEKLRRGRETRLFQGAQSLAI